LRAAKHLATHFVGGLPRTIEFACYDGVGFLEGRAVPDQAADKSQLGKA
jgi:hypothetical protein